MNVSPKYLLPLLLMFGGCASIIGDSTQPVSVDTPNCRSASCRLTNDEGIYFVKSTPNTVTISKSFGDLTAICDKDGNTATSIHKSKANVATFGNILLGGIPGALIDGGSGKGYDYPNYIINPLNCK